MELKTDKELVGRNIAENPARLRLFVKALTIGEANNTDEEQAKLTAARRLLNAPPPPEQMEFGFDQPLGKRPGPGLIKVELDDATFNGAVGYSGAVQCSSQTEKEYKEDRVQDSMIRRPVRLPAPLLFVGALAAQMGLTLFVQAATSAMLSARLSLWLTITFFFVSWFLMIGVVAEERVGKGLRAGWMLFRYYVAGIGGLSIAIMPFMFLPHPITAVAGVVLGFAFASWCACGKVHWLHRD